MHIRTDALSEKIISSHSWYKLILRQVSVHSITLKPHFSCPKDFCEPPREARVRHPSAIPVVFKKQKRKTLLQSRRCSESIGAPSQQHSAYLATAHSGWFYRLANRKFIMRNICTGFNFPRSSFERVNTTYARRNLIGPNSRFPECLSLAQSNHSLTFFRSAGASLSVFTCRVRLTHLQRRNETFWGNCCVHNVRRERAATRLLIKSRQLRKRTHQQPHRPAASCLSTHFRLQCREELKVGGVWEWGVSWHQLV